MSNFFYSSLTNKYLFANIIGMRYTFADFKKEYPNDNACLEAVFQNRYGNLDTCPKCGVVGTKFYRVKKRQCYACMHCGYQLFPLANTIFRKTRTSLWNWFYAIYLFSVAKNGVSAKELERHLGVTYKTAWRMAKQIRKLMADGTDKLGGEVEVDETHVGGKSVNSRTKKRTMSDKEVVFGMVEREGRVKTRHVKSSGARVLLPEIARSIETLAHIYSDEFPSYKGLMKRGWSHRSVNHQRGEYSVDGAHTNTIEGYWSQLKRSVAGTYHVVSPKYLQSYLDEFAFRYNYRHVAVAPYLLARVGLPV